MKRFLPLIATLALVGCAKQPNLSANDLSRTLSQPEAKVAQALIAVNKHLALSGNEELMMAKANQTYLSMNVPDQRGDVSAEGRTSFLSNSTQGTWCQTFGVNRAQLCLDYVSRVFATRSEAVDLFAEQGITIPATSENPGKPFRGKATGYFSEGVGQDGYAFFQLVVLADSQGLALTWQVPQALKDEFRPVALASFASLKFPP